MKEKDVKSGAFVQDEQGNIYLKLKDHSVVKILDKVDGKYVAPTTIVPVVELKNLEYITFNTLKSILLDGEVE